MKIATSFLAGLLFDRLARSEWHRDGCGWSNLQAKASSGSNLQEELTPGSYCHLKFPAIREETLSSDHPVLLDPSDGDIIDYYGPCDETHWVRIKSTSRN